MKKFSRSLALTVAACLALSACVSTPVSPTAPAASAQAGAPPAAAASVAETARIEAVKAACKFDAQIRPDVTLLLVVPNLATAKQVAVVDAARPIIDKVCADPSTPAPQAALSALTSIAVVYAELRAKHLTAAATPASAPN